MQGESGSTSNVKFQYYNFAIRHTICSIQVISWFWTLNSLVTPRHRITEPLEDLIGECASGIQKWPPNKKNVCRFPMLRFFFSFFRAIILYTYIHSYLQRKDNTITQKAKQSWIPVRIKWTFIKKKYSRQSRTYLRIETCLIYNQTSGKSPNSHQNVSDSTVLPGKKLEVW